MENVLIAGGMTQGGQYVVTNGPDSQEIVCASESPADALSRAYELGASDPILIYVPRDDEKTVAL